MCGALTCSLFVRQLGLTKLSLELICHKLKVVLVNRGQANGILHTYVQIRMCTRNSWNVNAEARATNPNTDAD